MTATWLAAWLALKERRPTGRVVVVCGGAVLLADRLGAGL